MPRRLGQHFLREAGWRERIARELRPQPEDVWLEIGAGHGEMTRELARRSRRVIAIELDAPLVQALEALRRECANLEVVAGDVLALDLKELAGGERLRVYGSLPYYITSPILRRLFEHSRQIRDISVVVQFEVAARIVCRPGRREYGFLSVLAQYYSQPELRLRIPPGAFRPPPKVASALVRLTIRNERAFADDPQREAEFQEWLGRCFSGKRKQIVNNLKGYASREELEEILEELEIRPDARAEQLSVEQLVALHRRLRKPERG